MRVLRVFKIFLTAATAALALSGCMQTRGPVVYAPAPHAQPQPVVAQPMASPRSDLDAMAYGTGPVPPAQAAAVPAVASRPPPPPAAMPPPVIAAAPPLPVLPPPRPGAAHKPVLLDGSLRAKPGVVVATTAPFVPPAAPVILYDPAYRLDAGDRLRIVVYGQEGLTNSYSVDAAGVVTLPLIGSVPARGSTPAELAAAVTARLRNGFIREPYVAVEIEAYRPFFILGEVAAPGQYPYVPNMTAEAAVAIAGGFTPRAQRSVVFITRVNQMGQARIVAAPNAPLSPGDTITVGERWF